RCPQRHGFIAATSWTRAGNVTWVLARATLTLPVSSGWRSESSTGRWNSGSSSRNRTPRVRKADLAWAHTQAPTDESWHRSAVVGRAERASAPDLAAAELSGDRGNHRDLQRLGWLQRRQNARQTSGEE